MKTLIVGTGIIGTLYGWALSEAGIDVTHYVRPGKAAQFQAGVRLDVLDERRGHTKQAITTYLLKCVEEVSPADGYELVVVPTSAYQVESALQALVPHTGEARFLIFTANWRGTGCLDAHLPRSRYVVGYPDGGGTLRDGVYWTNLGAQPHLGTVDAQGDALLDRVRWLFAGADMEPDLQANILHWLWLHNATTTPFQLGFARYRQIGPFLRDRALVRQCYVATRECIELCSRRGVRAQDYPEAGSFNLPAWLFFIMFRLLYATNASMQRYTAHAVESLREAKTSYLDILQTARECGLPMPQMEALGAYIQDI
jgi:ketopantoate reductase